MHDQPGNTAARPAFGWRNFAVPYVVFRDAGVEPTPASPKGGQPPNKTPATARFKGDKQKQLSGTVKLSDVKSADSGTIFYVGGHGPMWDIVDNPDAIALIQAFYNSGSQLPPCAIRRLCSI